MKEYSPELIYIQGSKNIPADALSRSDKVDASYPVKNNIMSINEYDRKYDEGSPHPTNYNTIM